MKVYQTNYNFYLWGQGCPLYVHYINLDQHNKSSLRSDTELLKTDPVFQVAMYTSVRNKQKLQIYCEK